VRIFLGVLTVLVPLSLTWWTDRVEWLAVSLVVLRLIVVAQQRFMLSRLGLLNGRPTLRQMGRGQGFWSESLWYAVLTPIGLAMSGFDRFLVAWIGQIDAATMAVFLAPQDMALRAIILPAALIPALQVRVAARIVEDADVHRIGARLIGIVGPVVFVGCALVSVLAPTFVGIVFASLDHASVIEVIRVLCIGVFSNALAQLPMANLSARGMVRDAALLQALQLPIYLSALGPLLANFGIAGAAWAWSGRIVLDTILLTRRANVRLPQFRVSGLHECHIVGVGLLSILGLGIL
jgi:O-antigen/teichoic acid export membrane protein